MPPMLAEFWKKLNTSEKFVMYGAGVVVIAFLIGVAAQRSNGTDLLWPILVAAIYFLKYSNAKIPWPVPVQLVVLGVAGVAAVFALLSLLPLISQISQLYGIAAAVNLVGSGVMAFFAWREYAGTQKAAPPKAPTKSA